jgi:hypothetical protein
MAIECYRFDPTAVAKVDGGDGLSQGLVIPWSDSETIIIETTYTKSIFYLV